MMKRALVGSIALTFVAGLVSAQNATTPSTTSPAVGMGTSPAAAASASMDFGSADSNKDGRISSAEAQSHSELRTSFATLDTDGDGYLSRTEYGKWNKADKEKDSTSAPAAPRSNSEMDSDSESRSTTPARPVAPVTPLAPANPAQ